MPREAKSFPTTWVTHIAPLIAGEASCWFSAWFRSQHTYDKLQNYNFDLTLWNIQHTQMIEARAKKLRSDGWAITVENQNWFKLKGQKGTLSGKPDIIATKDLDALVVDCKGGQHKHSHVVQVLEYLFALPLANPSRYVGKRIAGEVEYRDGSVYIAPEQFTEALKKKIAESMQLVSAPAAPAPVPSARECAFCDISSADCQARIETNVAEACVADW